MFLSVRLTVQRTCTAGLRPSQAPSWPSAVPGAPLTLYVSSQVKLLGKRGLGDMEKDEFDLAGQM